MEVDVYFPFYYGDYLKDTMQLTPEKHGIYLLLIIHCWQNNYIEDDLDNLSMVSKVSKSNKSLKYILEKYFCHEDGKYYQKRITKEKKLAIENRKANIERARKAANARWGNDA